MRAIFRRDQMGGFLILFLKTPPTSSSPDVSFLFSSSSSFFAFVLYCAVGTTTPALCCFHVSLPVPTTDQRQLTAISGLLVFQFFLFILSSLHLYDAMESTLLEHPRSPTFMDAPFTYDSLSNLEPYLQYPQSPYGVSSMACMSLLSYISIHRSPLPKCPAPRPHLPALTSTPST